jgi:hypothetical protein
VVKYNFEIFSDVIRSPDVWICYHSYAAYASTVKTGHALRMLETLAMYIDPCQYDDVPKGLKRCCVHRQEGLKLV